MTDYWLYTPEIDEAGCVAQGDTPEEALKNAGNICGWYPDPKAEVQWYVLGEGGTMIVPNYPFRSEDECDDFCGPHAEGCDGYCDHLGHRNMCLNDAEYEAQCKEYNDG